MKLQLSRLLLLVSAIAILGATTVGCKKKAKDADVKAAIETTLAADPMAVGAMVDVKDGVATLTGECKDDMCKMHVAEVVGKMKDVKSVVNNLTVAAPAVTAPVISPDDELTTAVKDALTAFPGVSATVKDGIISLTGKIAKADRQKLMMVLQALKPKKVDVAGLTNK